MRLLKSSLCPSLCLLSCILKGFLVNKLEQLYLLLFPRVASRWIEMLKWLETQGRIIYRLNSCLAIFIQSFSGEVTYVCLFFLRHNLYGPPQSKRDLIDLQLSIDVDVLMHIYVGVHKRERTTECHCLSLVVQLHLCNSHLHTCISGKNTQSDQKYLSMHANALYLTVFIQCLWVDIYDKCYMNIYLLFFKLGTLLYLSQIHCSNSYTV